MVSSFLEYEGTPCSRMLRDLKLYVYQTPVQAPFRASTLQGTFESTESILYKLIR